MNPNSFPGGEQSQEQPTYNAFNSLNEFPSFDEHMQEIATKDNARNLSRPSLKNEELENGAQYMGFAVENLSKKIKDGQRLEVVDITSLTDEKGFGHTEQIGDYLLDLGINNGKDFDIRLPAEVISMHGKKEKTPLSISFNNGEDFTRVDISKDRDGATIVSSYTGKGEEGVDVGYDGPVSRDYQPDNFKTEKFE